MFGNKLGPYDLIEEIGQGGMASVYRAYQPNMDRFVAVKVIHKAISLNATALERFTREARLIARLEHPHILPVYDYNGESDPPYIVMRYLPSGTLKDIISRDSLSLTDVNILFNQIASALDYAHRQGVIHRDIKPSNIMIDSEGHAFLTDFGIARLIEGDVGLTGSGVAIGTPGYMAPEQGLGGTVDARTDIYALGVMLYEMISGKLPFSAQTPMEIIIRHINDPVPDVTATVPGAPPALNDVIKKAMAKSPDDRYASASELSRAVSAAIGPVSDPSSDHLQKIAAQTTTALAQERQERSQMAGTAAKPLIISPITNAAPAGRGTAPASAARPRAGAAAAPPAASG